MGPTGPVAAPATVTPAATNRREISMISMHHLMAFLDDFMGAVADKDPHMPNGLQVRGREEVKLLATGVSVSLRLFAEAVARNADALLVHHGLEFPSRAIAGSRSRL